MSVNNFLNYEIDQMQEIDFCIKSTIPINKMCKVNMSKDVADTFRLFFNQGKIAMVESIYIMLLNRSNRVLSICKISEGTDRAALCDIKLVFGLALKCQAAALIICHNHPSGNTTPSEADFDLTQKLINAGKYFDIPILDHIILSPEINDYSSMADCGHITRMS